MRPEGKLIVISGPSGVGKSTVCAELLQHPSFERVVTCTTRSARPGETDGTHYHFMSREAFEAGVRSGRFLEHAMVHGHLYGTPRREVEEAVRRGKRVLLNIDVQGAEQLRARWLEETTGARESPDGEPVPLMTIFLAPPDERILEERLRGRGTEGGRDLSLRLEEARREMGKMESYDHVVVNRKVEDTVAEILELAGLRGSGAGGARTRGSAPAGQ